MKLTSQGKQLFLSDLRAGMRAREWSVTKLAKEAGVHQSQVSRIAAGNFKTFGANVMKICMTLGMEPSSYWVEGKANQSRRVIADAAIAIWDGSQRDFDLVVAVLQDIGRLRRRGAKN